MHPGWTAQSVFCTVTFGCDWHYEHSPAECEALSKVGGWTGVSRIPYTAQMFKDTAIVCVNLRLGPCVPLAPTQALQFLTWILQKIKYFEKPW